MHVAVIINPVSGRHGWRAATGPERAALARRVLAARGLDGDVHLTRGPGDAAALAQATVTGGADLVVAWGGDGTVNEVAGPLIGTRTVLGLVRGGSGDGFARCLGVPADVEQAFEAALGGSSAAVDVGYLGGRHFLNIGGVGFDAVVAASFNRRRRRGTLGYATRMLVLVWTYACQRYRVQADGQFSDRARLLVAFANGRQYGSGFVLAPDADPSDGWLDAVMVDAGDPRLQLWRARRLIIAPRRPAFGIERLRVRSATIAVDEGDHLLCHVDGEAFEVKDSVDVGIRPGALHIAGIRDRSSVGTGH